MEFGKKIKEARKRQRLTQKQLADRLNIAEITVRKYEGDKRQPSIDQLQHIADALDAPFVDLLPFDFREKITSSWRDIASAIDEVVEETPKILDDENRLNELIRFFQPNQLEMLCSILSEMLDLTNKEMLAVQKSINLIKDFRKQEDGGSA